MSAQYYSASAASEKIEEVDEEEQLMWRSEHSHIHSITEGEDGDEDDSEDELMIEDASSMSSSPSIPDENIDFDLVYALHTFVATVEGQASVVKGDALILLEDTNIYWWLVEVLKTREVGYIPAENIETPYERLARLNKHRNVEITSPSIHDITTPIIIPHPLHPPRRVTIGDESMSRIFHYEVESEYEDDETDRYEEFHYDREEGSRYQDIVEDEFQEMIMDSYSEKQHDLTQEWQEKNWDDDDGKEAKQSFEEARFFEQEQQQRTSQDSVQANSEEETQVMELRVFAGNIGQGPLFHSLSISASTTADELIKASVGKFGIMEAESSEDATIEHYIAVQGMDGDEYVLSAQDKPFSIFKTLTDSLTTPMPSLKHIHRISQQSMSSIQSRSSTNRRPRSSSFSNYEQTSYDEDSVIRFYLHRRIKRAHEREGLLYIKVSLYPDETAIASSPVVFAPRLFSDAAAAFTKNPTPIKSKKRQQKISTRSEIDRIDKIISVRHESPIGAVINLALEKFHVPDAQADDYTEKMNHLRDSRQLGKYRMSVRGNSQETELNPYELMSNVLLQQQTSSPNHSGPITSDLLFVLRKTGSNQHSPSHNESHKKPPAPPHLLGSEDRRPSILDILMDNSPRTSDRRPSAMSNLLEPSSRLVDESRRPSGSNIYHAANHDRKLSLNPQQQQQCFHQQQSPSSSSSSSFPITKSSNSLLGFNRRSSNQSSSVISGSSLDERINSDSTIIMESNLDITPTSSSSIRQQPSTTSERKKESFKQQFKRLVGWGTSTSNKKQASLNLPPPLTTPFSNHKQGIDSPSDIIFVSAPSTPLPPTPGTPGTPGTPRSPIPPPKTRQSSISHPLEVSTPSISRRPSETISMSDPSAAAVAAAAVISASSKRLSTVSSISSDSSTSSVTSEEIAAATSQTLELGDDEDDDTEEEEENNPTAEDKDIQTQYAMWMNSQPEEAAPVVPIKPATKALPPIVPTPSKSPMRNKVAETETKKDDVLHPMPSQTGKDLDDLYLLVAHGVDFLTSRENTKWEEEGGYEFHPWNRPQSSYAVRDKESAMSVAEVENCEETTSTISPVAGPLLLPPTEEQQEPISPPLTPLTQHQEEEPPSAMAKRVLGANKQEVQSSSSNQSQSQPQQQSQQHTSVDDEELQRIVAAHIVF